MFELPSPWAPLSVFEIKNSSDDYLFESRKLPNFDYIFLTSDNQTELENARMETNAYLKFEKSTGMLIESDIGMAILFDNGEWVEVYMLLSPLEMSLDGFQILDNYHYNEVYIRVASFSFKESAQDIVDTINSKHHSKIIEHFNNDGVKKYMVVIGPFKNIDNLLRILNDDTIDKYEDLSIFLI